jgi:tRNA1Val (adenine37-N6)-methyltransferase
MSKIVKNSLGFDSNLYIYQDKEAFNYSIDTILLGNFLTINVNTKHILEVGTNNGALSIFISERKKDLKIDAIEIQKKAINLAKKNIYLNKKEKNINLINANFNDFYKNHSQNQQKKYNTIVCNPPFYKIDSKIKKKGNDELLIATHEIKLNLEQLIKGSSKIIEQKGYLAIVMPTERFIDICEFMRKYSFEPKRVQFVYPRVDSKSNLVLVEARFKTG